MLGKHTRTHVGCNKASGNRGKNGGCVRTADKEAADEVDQKVSWLGWWCCLAALLMVGIPGDGCGLLVWQG
jgi:hypothetical protein